MSFTIEQTTTYVAEACCSCGMQFAMTSEINERLRRNHKEFYCPAGHRQWYLQKSTEEKLREEIDVARERTRRADFRLDHANRSRAALKGQVTKIKRRVGRGICPCCNRTFKNLGDHMESTHPDWSEE